MKINTNVGDLDVDITTITISENYNSIFDIFHCPFCTLPLFRYKGRLLTVEPGEVPTEIPIILRCRRSNCGHGFLIKTFVLRDKS